MDLAHCYFVLHIEPYLICSLCRESVEKVHCKFSVSLLLGEQSRVVTYLHFIRPHCSPSSVLFILTGAVTLFRWKNGAQHRSNAALGSTSSISSSLLSKVTSLQHACLPLSLLQFHNFTFTVHEKLKEPVLPPL